MKGRTPGVGTLPPEKIELIIELHQQGKHISTIAKRVECSKRTVYNYCYRLALL